MSRQHLSQSVKKKSPGASSHCFMLRLFLVLSSPSRSHAPPLYELLVYVPVSCSKPQRSYILSGKLMGNINIPLLLQQGIILFNRILYFSHTQVYILLTSQSTPHLLYPTTLLLPRVSGEGEGRGRRGKGGGVSEGLIKFRPKLMSVVTWEFRER